MPDARAKAIIKAIRGFQFDDYGMDDVDPTSQYAEWVADLAKAIVAALPATPVVTIRRPDDERIEIVVGRTVVASANHDEHGWSGMDAVQSTAMAVAKAFGGKVATNG